VFQDERPHPRNALGAAVQVGAGQDTHR